jgi:hypothetical protein
MAFTVFLRTKYFDDTDYNNIFVPVEGNLRLELET